MPTGAACYRHGYDDPFDNEAVTPCLPGLDSHLEPWHVVPLQLAGEAVEGFRARHRPGGGTGQITLTYVNETLLFPMVGEPRTSP